MSLSRLDTLSNSVSLMENPDIYVSALPNSVESKSNTHNNLRPLCSSKSTVIQSISDNYSFVCHTFLRVPAVLFQIDRLLRCSLLMNPHSLPDGAAFPQYFEKGFRGDRGQTALQ